MGNDRGNHPQSSLNGRKLQDGEIYILYSKLSRHADSLPLRKALKQSMSKEEKKRPLAQAYSVGVWMGMGNLVNGQFIMC